MGRGKDEGSEDGVEGRTEKCSKEKDTLAELACMCLTRNLAWKKFLGIHKDGPNSESKAIMERVL